MEDDDRWAFIAETVQFSSAADIAPHAPSEPAKTAADAMALSDMQVDDALVEIVECDYAATPPLGTRSLPEPDSAGYRDRVSTPQRASDRDVIKPGRFDGPARTVASPGRL